MGFFSSRVCLTGDKSFGPLSGDCVCVVGDAESLRICDVRADVTNDVREGFVCGDAGCVCGGAGNLKPLRGSASRDLVVLGD